MMVPTAAAFQDHPAMRITSLRLPVPLLVLLLAAGTAPAVIMKLTPLAEILENEDYIFVATIDRVDPDKPAAVFKVEKQLKGKPPYERIPVNMTGNDEAKKAGDTKTILGRLDAKRKAIFFVGKRGKNHNAKVFVEGSWFSVHGTEDPADKVVRWAFQNGEPFLRRTFKGTSAELIRVIEDGLAKKAKPPAPDDKEKPGYGPAAEKKDAPKPPATPLSRDAERSASPALFGVIPSLALIGPAAALAALFPGVMARMAVGMKRWRAFLVVASIDSTLALTYWAINTYWPAAVPGGWAFGLKAFTLYLMLVSAVGLGWAGRRYRRAAAADPAATNPPTRAELLTLAGLAAFAGLSAVLVGLFVEWRANLELPMREFTFIGIAVLVALFYAGYRKVTRCADHAPDGKPADRRLSLSGESVGLATLFLCGFTVLVSGGSRGPVASGTEEGDADTIGPRFVAVQPFLIPKTTQVMSGITVVGDRLYFGTQFVRSTQEGNLVCMDRETGEVKWKFGDDEGMKPVYCTPREVGGKIYCGEGLHTDKDCRMFCVNAADGTPAWGKPFETGSHTEGGPAVGGGKVYFPAGDDGLIAADANSGQEKWRFRGGKDAGIHIDAAPATDGKRVFVGSGLYSFVAVALDAESGNELWRTDLRLRCFGAPFVSAKFVYFGVGTGNVAADVHNYPEEADDKEKSAAGAVICLEADTGKEVWRFELPRSVHTGLTGDAFSIYAASRDGYVYAIDRKTGKLRWKTGIGGAVTSRPAVATAGGMPAAVYAVSREGSAVCLNPHSGKLVWQRQLPGFHWDGQEANGVLSGPTVVTTSTPTGSKRAIYIGAMVVDPDNPAKKTGAVFRIDDEIGGE
jgi:outer membrane protein assembly factor BamB